MRRVVPLFLITQIVLVSACGFARGATPIPASQKDTFQDGTTDNWTNGPSGDPLQVIANGGPAGAGDQYLKITSSSHLATFNLTQWAGDYTANNVMDIGVDFLNPNANTADHIAMMRIVLFGQSGSRWTSTNAVTVPTDNTWHHLVFSLRQSDLTQVVAGDTYASVIGNAERLMFRHDNGTIPSSGGTPFFGALGIDNVTAIATPEPVGLIWLIAIATSLRRRRSRLSA